MKPREWSLVFDSFGAVQGAYTIQPRDSEPRDSTIQVIEMSAYDKLIKENAAFREALKLISSPKMRADGVAYGAIEVAKSALAKFPKQIEP